MKHYKWQDLPEDAMPADGSVLRRFVNGQEMTMARVSFTEGSAVPAHRHENEQFSLVLSGTMEFTVEGKPVLVQAGEVLFLPANELHGARALQDAVVLDVFAPPRKDWPAPPSEGTT